MMYNISLFSSIGSYSDIVGKSGLVHVCEHSVLAHHMNKHTNSSLLTIGGKTDFYSCSITFSMPREYVAVEEQSMIDDILNGQYLSALSLEQAKNEVIDECIERRQYDRSMGDIISFVTDGAISAMPTGNTSEVQSITLGDAQKGHPFGCKSSLIYLEHDSERIYQLVYMPANPRSVVNIDHKAGRNLKFFDGNRLRFYFAMPTSESYADTILRSIVEFILKSRMKNKSPKIQKIFHKHLFREYSHLIVAFESCSIITEELALKFLDVMSDSCVTKRELTYAKRSVASFDMNDLMNESIGDIQSFLSYGSPSMYLLTRKKIVDLIHSISSESVSAYMQKLCTNIHIIKSDC